jgi:YHS domain-containing protein
MPEFKNSLPLRLVCAALFAMVLLAAGFAQAGSDAGKTTPVQAGLKKVETKKVCMINNQVFEKDQIPVQVAGKTYYGCCEMCKERLAKDAEARTAVDPVTGKKVDKATAVIAALPDLNVLYFESDATLKRYQAGERKK